MPRRQMGCECRRLYVRVTGPFASRQFAAGHLAALRFAAGHFATGTFWCAEILQSEILPLGHFTLGHLAARTIFRLGNFVCGSQITRGDFLY